MQDVPLFEKRKTKAARSLNSPPNKDHHSPSRITTLSPDDSREKGSGGTRREWEQEYRRQGEKRDTFSFIQDPTQSRKGASKKHKRKGHLLIAQ